MLVVVFPHLCEAGELPDGEDARREARHVGGEGSDGELGERLAEADADEAVAVLALHDGRVRVGGGDDGGALHDAELHLGAPAERGVGGEQHGRATAAEEAVAQHHGPVDARVAVGRDALRGDDER